jgi:GNAT superfamily N-acetyltransferase
VLLVYRGFDSPVLFALGAPVDLEPLLGEIGCDRTFYLSVREEVPGLLASAGYRIERLKPMRRMVLDLDRYSPGVASDARWLGPPDLGRIEALYRDGDSTGEAPEFFQPSMLGSGIYFGIEQDGALVAVAGTHVLAPRQGVACIGNIYTRRDRRRRGLGLNVIAAVTAELCGLGIPTIALNVARANQTAIGVYEQLGFRTHCEYVEARAIDE